MGMTCQGGTGEGAGLHFPGFMAGQRWGRGASDHFSLGLESGLVEKYLNVMNLLWLR